jgi:hypothetical protein
LDRSTRSNLAPGLAAFVLTVAPWWLLRELRPRSTPELL